jgi:hypothetical protein
MNLKGEPGSNYYADTSAHTGDWCAIQALTTATFTAFASNCAGASAFTLPAGATIYGIISGFTLSVGTVIAYNRK